jgi:hypothetical protein
VFHPIVCPAGIDREVAPEHSDRRPGAWAYRGSQGSVSVEGLAPSLWAFAPFCRPRLKCGRIHSANKVVFGAHADDGVDFLNRWG